MPRPIDLLVVVALIAVAAPLRADGYTIKIKKSAQGDFTKQDKEETDHSSFKYEGPDGKVLQDRKEERAVTQSYKETILVKEKGKKAAKLRRTYTKAVVKTGDKQTVLPYEGKTVLIEKKEDGKYHFTIEKGAMEEGEELSGKDAELLNRSFNKGSDDSDEEDVEKVFLPSKPVKEGDTWTIDAAALIKTLEKGVSQPIPTDKDKAKGEGKLLRVYKEGDRQYGDMDIDINIPLKGDFPLGKGQTAPLQSGSKMTMKVHYKRICIDGTAGDRGTDLDFETSLGATFKGPDGKEYKISINSKHKEKSKKEDLPKPKK